MNPLQENARAHEKRIGPLLGTESAIRASHYYLFAGEVDKAIDAVEKAAQLKRKNPILHGIATLLGKASFQTLFSSEDREYFRRHTAPYLKENVWVQLLQKHRDKLPAIVLSIIKDKTLQARVQQVVQKIIRENLEESGDPFEIHRHARIPAELQYAAWLEDWQSNRGRQPPNELKETEIQRNLERQSEFFGQGPVPPDYFGYILKRSPQQILETNRINPVPNQSTLERLFNDTHPETRVSKRLVEIVKTTGFLIKKHMP
ncbi:hypothetical protein HY572_07015 [Candidatus Micrarchaeota archaeon]|nr:hypothetical protein [Candidatus Micrarchaeota archaeon]